jgi:hypothetical protein
MSYLAKYIYFASGVWCTEATEGGNTPYAFNNLGKSE